MDSVYRKLRSNGVGAEKQSAEPFTKEEENKLWEQVIMGNGSPEALLRAVFFYNGKNVCLRGGEEHRNLRLSQLKRTQNGYVYTENASKNRECIQKQTRRSRSVTFKKLELYGAHTPCAATQLHAARELLSYMFCL